MPTPGLQPGRWFVRWPRSSVEERVSRKVQVGGLNPSGVTTHKAVSDAGRTSEGHSVAGSIGQAR